MFQVTVTFRGEFGLDSVRKFERATAEKAEELAAEYRAHWNVKSATVKAI